MYNLDPNFIRSAFLGKYIKDLIDNTPEINITSVSEKAEISRTTFNNAVNGRTVGSDSMFIKAFKALGITETEIKKIFQKADEEEYRYKYGSDINKLPLEGIDLTEFEKEELGKILFSKVVGVEPTKEDVEVMLEMIRMSNRNKK